MQLLVCTYFVEMKPNIDVKVNYYSGEDVENQHLQHLSIELNRILFESQY